MNEKKINLFEACRLLKEKRQELNVSLEKISYITKLSPSILRRIENQDRLSDMNQVYLKGFIRLYASYLKEDDVLRSLDDIFLDRSKKEAKSSTPIKAKHFVPRPKIKIPNIMPIVLIAAAVIFFILIIFVLMSTFKLLRGGRKSPVSLSKKNKISVAVPVKNIHSKASPSGLLAPLRSSNSEYKITLGLRARSEIFIRVKVDGVLVFQSILPRGGQNSWMAKNKIELKVNNPSFADIEFNGKIISSKRRKSALYIFTPSGYSSR